MREARRRARARARGRPRAGVRFHHRSRSGATAWTCWPRCGPPTSSAAKQLHKHLGAGFPFEILEHLRGLERRINEAAHASAQSGDTANSLDANDADYCAAPHSVSPSGHASRTPSRTRRSSVRKRRRPELSGSIDALADVCADVPLAWPRALLRLAHATTWPSDGTPLDRWIAQRRPLDRLSIETYLMFQHSSTTGRPTSRAHPRNTLCVHARRLRLARWRPPCDD